MQRGIVYTETVVFSPPAQYANDVPYQLAILDLDDGKRLTVRVLGEHVKIGDTVHFVEERDGVPYFRL